MSSDELNNAMSNNAEMSTAWQIIENTSANLFLTGKAGTGKTTFLHLLRNHSSKRIIVLAPTGIAAINAKGSTIHSFFQLALSPFLSGATHSTKRKRVERFNRDKLRILRTMDLMVIDEISMVRSDILDAVDDVLRRHRDPTRPFGGVQLLLIGDLQQLPPVVPSEQWEMLKTEYSTPYFFSSRALNEAGYMIIELLNVYRQKDIRFIDLLNRIRTNHVDKNTLALLNSRYHPSFKPDETQGYIRLTTHNQRADEINKHQLQAIDAPSQNYTAKVEGDFPEIAQPTDRTLTLKVGAQVMFLKNDPEQGYFNGMMAHVIALTPNSAIVRPIGSDNKIEVMPATWENTDYSLDSEKGSIVETIRGTFSQIPLRLAWAITIHKSQGLTFDKAIIDATHAFAHGQIYVALSRCRSLEGLVLERPIPSSAIILDAAIDSFNATHDNIKYDESHIDALKTRYTIECLDNIISPKPLREAFNRLYRIVQEYISRDYPILAHDYDEANVTITETIEKVAHAFAKQYRGIPATTPLFQERIDKAFRYFTDTLRPLIDLIIRTPETTDNKTVTTRLRTARTELNDIVQLKLSVMHSLTGQPFCPSNYLAAKAKATVALETSEFSKKKDKRHLTSTFNPPRIYHSGLNEPTNLSSGKDSDITDPILYETLCNWRRELMKEKNCPAYIILSNRALLAIASQKPTSLKTVKEIPGIGPKKIALYGSQIINIVLTHVKSTQ